MLVCSQLPDAVASQHIPLDIAHGLSQCDLHGVEFSGFFMGLKGLNGSHPLSSGKSAELNIMTEKDDSENNIDN
jgi:hypothetical protein